MTVHTGMAHKHTCANCGHGEYMHDRASSIVLNPGPCRVRGPWNVSRNQYDNECECRGYVKRDTVQERMKARNR